MLLPKDFFTNTRPPRRRTSESYLEYLRRAYSLFRSALPTAPNGPSWFEQQLWQLRAPFAGLADGIVGAVEAVLSGDIFRAQADFDAALAGVSAQLDVLVSKDGPNPPLAWLYRARMVDGLTQRTTGDLFHIPFHRRHLVATQRFSLPGVPCLYLGSSTYACWEELGRPNIEKLVSIGLKPVKNARFLNLAYTTEYLLSVSLSTVGVQQSPLSEFLLAYATIWPLVLAVHVPRRHTEPETRFVEEYIAPQLLLRWVRKAPACQGIRYFSCHVDPRTDPRVASNFVFPTTSSPTKGHCSFLKSIFRVTDPLHWSLGKATNCAQACPNINAGVAVSANKVVPYAQTSFFEFDGMIRNLPVRRLR